MMHVQTTCSSSPGSTTPRSRLARLWTWRRASPPTTGQGHGPGPHQDVQPDELRRSSRARRRTSTGTRLLEGMGLTPEHLATVVNAQPSFFTGLDELLTPDELDAWSLLARWHAGLLPPRRVPLGGVVAQNFASMARCCPGPRSCASGGSAASGRRTARWARPWAA
ncbi:hypothetical protein QJS66_16465 [Kocuria rhizophila]|nr:hypothetical protein QJS66_16465 [Kocuria rhizophila]